MERRKGWHDALISLDVYNLNQKRLGSEIEGKRVRLKNNPDFELCGLVVCAQCKSSLRAYWAKGRKGRYPYYECKNKECSLRGKTIRKSELEGDFRELINEFKPKDGLTEVVAAMFEDVWKDCVKEQVGETLLNQNLIKSLQEEITLLTDKLAVTPTGDVIEEELRKRIGEKVSRRKEIENELAKVSDLNIPYRTAADQVFMALKNPLKLWSSATIEQKKQIFFFFFNERLEYERKKSYRTAQISPILRLFERKDNSHSLDVVLS